MAFKKGCVPWNKGLKCPKRGPLSDEIKAKISASKKGCKRTFSEEHLTNLFKARHGPSYGAEFKKKISESAKRNYPYGMREGWLRWMQSKKGMRNTRIEIKVQNWLKIHNINFTTQFKCGKYLYDIHVPSCNLLIECDGTYWHSRPENIIRDKEKNINAITHSCKIVRLSDVDINSGIFETILTNIFVNSK
jgi:very-short-patch-repair endonuclease